MSSQSEELTYLKKLIADFPADVKPGDAAKALRKIATRYQSLEGEHFFQGVSPSELAKSDLPPIPYIFQLRAVDIHRVLFKGILSNAGEIRKTSDPGNGKIGFGGFTHQRHQLRFRGTNPRQIDEEMKEAFAHLILEPEDCVEKAMRFYQHFVYIHPFYDANGRIGRVIVSDYLNLFGLYVQWGEFDGPNNGKFIKKLNACHDRMKSGYTFEEYLSYLISFFRQYVISVDELSDFSK